LLTASKLGNTNILDALSGGGRGTLEKQPSKLLIHISYQNLKKKCNYLAETLAEKVHFKKDSVAALGRTIENPHKTLSQLQIEYQTDNEPEILERCTAKFVFVEK
jgi:hypothetical protein